MVYDPNASYQPGGTTTAFPGSPPAPGQAAQQKPWQTSQWVSTSGLTKQWANATVVKDPSAEQVDAAKNMSADAAEHYVGGTPTTIGQMLYMFDSGQASSDDVMAIQNVLYQGGFYSKDAKFTPGQKDNATRTAFVHALKEAARSKTPFAEFLDARAQARQAAGITSGSARQPFVAEVTNPDDIKAVLRDTLKNKLGRGEIPEGKLNAMVSAFQSQEAAAQQAEYSLTNPGGGGTVVKPPDLSTFADTQAHQADPTAYDANKVVSTLSLFAKALGGQ